MAFDALPPSWISGWSEDGTNITIPLATFTEMTAAEADATTGDIRKCLYAICEHLKDQWESTATADLPGKMTISTVQTVNSSTGVITKRYTLSFDTEPTGVEVANE